MDSLSIGLNSNFSKNLKEREPGMLQSIAHNPLNDDDQEERKLNTDKKQPVFTT